VRELSSPARFQEMLDKVSPSTRELIVRAPSATDWLPIGALDELFRTALAICYQNDIGLVFEQGRRSFIRDVKSVYKVFIRFSSPEHVIRRASQIYGTYYRSNGSLRVAEQKPHELVLVYQEVVLGSPAFWEQSRGTLHGALEATGMKNIETRVVAGGGEEKNCTYRVQWGA
jgi:Protein of unknown function (DUF2378)